VAFFVLSSRPSDPTLAEGAKASVAPGMYHRMGIIRPERRKGQE